MPGNKCQRLVTRKLEPKGRKGSYFGYKTYPQKTCEFSEDISLFVQPINTYFGPLYPRRFSRHRGINEQYKKKVTVQLIFQLGSADKTQLSKSNTASHQKQIYGEIQLRNSGVKCGGTVLHTVGG